MAIHNAHLDTEEKPFWSLTNLWLQLAIGLLAALVCMWWFKPTTSIIDPIQESLTDSSIFETETPIAKKITDRLLIGETLANALTRHNVSATETQQLISELASKLNLKSLRAGDAFVLEHNVMDQNTASTTQTIKSLELVLFDNRGIPTRYIASAHQDPTRIGFNVSKIEIPINEQLVDISGQINSSLYDSVIGSGGDADLVNRFANVFGSQVDFYRESQPSDIFKLIVSKKIADGRTVGFGNVLAAEYINKGKIYRGFHYVSKIGNIRGIFDEKGVSLERAFLRSPMEITRITSPYGKRFHPILRRNKIHNGIDYGAPRNTPFWAVADGVVVEAGYHRFNGNWIKLRHQSGFETEYMHASRIATGIKRGSQIHQGQIIGYVGSTGLSTAPHLHLGFKLNGRYVDPSKQKYGGEKRIPQHLLEGYLATVRPLVDRLNKIEVAKAG